MSNDAQLPAVSAPDASSVVVGVGGGSAAASSSSPQLASSSQQPQPLKRQSTEYVTADLNVLQQQQRSKDIEPDSDAVLMAKNVVRLGAEAFWVVYGCMLTVFVPQQCTAADSGIANDIPHECKWDENFTNLSSFNAFCLGWNFISLFFTCVHYYIMWQRESFFTRYLDYSLTHSRIYLRDTIHNQPALHTQLQRHNTLMLYDAMWLTVVQLVNYITSAVMILQFYPGEGFRAETVLISNFFLTFAVLYRSLDNAYIGRKHDLAFSSFSLEPYSYNVIGLEHRQQ